jgi:hypothetical protein
MAGPFSGSEFLIKIAPDNDGSPGTYTDFSVDAASFTPSGGERASGSIHTAGRATPHVTTGKKQAVNVTINVLYKTGASDLFKTLRGYFDNNTRFWIQYIPALQTGDDTGFNYGPGYLTSCPAPAGDASTGDSLALEVAGIFEGEAIATIA